MTERTFYIEGMTCSGCEHRLETAVGALEGIAAVRADRKNGILTVRYDAPCTEEVIVQAVEAAGYHTAETPRRRWDGIYVLVILLGLFLIARQLGWTEFFKNFPPSAARRWAMRRCFWWDF